MPSVTAPKTVLRCSMRCCGGSSMASPACCRAPPTRRREARALCESGPARHPQDARLRAFPQASRQRMAKTCRLVRTRPLHPEARHAVFCRSLRQYALDHRHAHRNRIVGSENTQLRAPRPKPENLEDGVLDGLWRTYYRTIFNPARLKTKRHDERDAATLLEQHAGNGADSRTDRRRAEPRRRDGPGGRYSRRAMPTKPDRVRSRTHAAKTP